MHPSAYGASFYAGHQDGSARSASVVVPLLLQHFRVGSVVDVGCGVGAWLAEFERHGVADYLGIDGDHVPRNLLRIPANRFHTADLRRLESADRRFDLACSLEVAEHLPPDLAEPFIAALIGLAPVVLFSAAIPGQGGTAHVNERWQSYWAGLFRARGYVAFDCIRPMVFGDDRVELWYRQNTLVFCEPNRAPAQFVPIVSDYELDRIDPALFEARCRGKRETRKGLRGLLRSRAG